MKTAADLDMLETACFQPDSGSQYNRHIFRQELTADIEAVWEAYLSLNPKELGLHQIITFGLCYSRSDHKLIYDGDPCGKIEAGQIIFSGLSYLKGLVKLAVAQEITEINLQQKFMTFCYMSNGKTLGSQQIRFTPSDNGGTMITHETFYRSKSAFRDKKLYPGLHKKTIMELHEKAQKNIRGGETSSIK